MKNVRKGSNLIKLFKHSYSMEKNKCPNEIKTFVLLKLNKYINKQHSNRIHFKVKAIRIKIY